MSTYPMIESGNYHPLCSLDIGEHGDDQPLDPYLHPEYAVNLCHLPNDRGAYLSYLRGCADG
jgi:hypothetical protein